MTMAEQTNSAEPDTGSAPARRGIEGKRPGLWSRFLWGIARESYRKRLLDRVKAAAQSNQRTEAVRELRRLAALGDRDAQYELGRCYAEGLGVVKNLPEAVIHMEAAARQEHPGAQAFLAKTLSYGLGNMRDFFDPVRWYATAEGPAGENRNLFYPAGVDVARDEAAGLHWCLKAAENGHPVAMVQLAQRHASGAGVEQDQKRALELLEKAAELGYMEAHLFLGRVCRTGELGGMQDLERAVTHLRLAAEGGVVDAGFELSLILIEPGPHNDFAEAARWSAIAAEKGHTRAQVLLAGLYRRGEGVPQDHYKAAQWFRRAAKAKHPVAQLNMGRLHEMGLGAEKDLYEAAEWYRLAADQGNAQACFNLAALYVRGQGVLRDPQKAGELFLKAARQGHPEARLNLGMLHMRGDLAPSDLKRALMWFLLGKQLVTPEQAAHVDRLIETINGRLTPDQIAAAHELAAAWTPEAPEL